VSSDEGDEKFQLRDPNELLYRQVHPSWVVDGRPSSQAFRPTRKDEGKLSVSRGALTTARTSFELYTAALELQSAGVWGVCVGECDDEGLETFSDPLHSPPSKVADPSHAVINFAGVSSSQAEAKAGRLRRKATERGCLYKPPPTE
jgi:hypothetical protein